MVGGVGGGQGSKEEDMAGHYGATIYLLRPRPGVFI